MRSPRVARLAAAVATTVLPLSLLVACGDSGDSGDSGDATQDSSSASEEPGDGGGASGSSDADPTETEPASEEERLLAVVENQVDFENLPAEAFGVIPEGLPEGVLPADQDPNYVVGMGDAEGGWVLFVQSTYPAPDVVALAAERLTQAGYAESQPVDVSEVEALAAPDGANPADFGELRTFALDPVVVGVAANAVDVGEDVPLQSVLMFVVSPA